MARKSREEQSADGSGKPPLGKLSAGSVQRPPGSGKSGKGKDGKEDPKRSRWHEVRETVESVLIAFILAFLFRTFEAEAFVIPTGSMAPTLRGRHKEADCPQCGYRVVVGASTEVEKENPSQLQSRANRISTAFCPNCRFELPIKDDPVFGGDRILVTKFPYEIGEPDRWDVIVFKWPNQPTMNYIKRLVGLPGEQLFISQGDVFVSKKEDGPITPLRKDNPNKQRELQILVYDNDHPEKLLHSVGGGWPERWAPMQKSSDAATERLNGWVDDTEGWTIDSEERALSLAATNAQDWAWIRYRHFVPDPSVWQEALQAQAANRPANFDLTDQPQLITDFCGYNAVNGAADNGAFWVGDLTVSADVTISETQADAALLLELNEGSNRYRCEIDLATGLATLYYPDPVDRGEGSPIVLGTAETDLSETGDWHVRFANVDDRLCLWIDGGLVDFQATENAATTPQPDERVGVYRRLAGPLSPARPTEADLVPVGIAARGASVTVSHLLLERDIYYGGSQLDEDLYLPGMQQPPNVRETPYSDGELAQLTHNPAAWWDAFADLGGFGDDIGNPDDPAGGRRYRRRIRFERLGDDHFFALGDNSPSSLDSRFWPPDRPWHRDDRWLNLDFMRERSAVPRSALIGKAFYVYWPHGIPFLNEGDGWGVGQHAPHQVGENTVTEDDARAAREYSTYRIPFYPDFSRMKRIR